MKYGIKSPYDNTHSGEKRPEFVGALDDLKAIVRAVIEENPLQQSGVVITGNSFVIRQESDIRKVAEELYRLEAKKRRGGI